MLRGPAQPPPEPRSARTDARPGRNQPGRDCHHRRAQLHRVRPTALRKGKVLVPGRVCQLRWLAPPPSRRPATPSLVGGLYFAGGQAYAHFNRGSSRGACCVRIPACRYTSQTVGVCCRSTIKTVPSLDLARRCVSSRAPLKNVKGADTVNCDWPPCCSTHCSRVPRKHCQSLRLRYTMLRHSTRTGIVAGARPKCGDTDSTLARLGFRRIRVNPVDTNESFHIGFRAGAHGFTENGELRSRTELRSLTPAR